MARKAAPRGAIENDVPIPLRGKGHVGTDYDKARREFEPEYGRLCLEGYFNKRGSKTKFAETILKKYPNIENRRTIFNWMTNWDAYSKNS